jgi:hypothetical protein
VTARIYWYPEDTGPLRELDLGRYWSELVEADAADNATARTADGQRVMTTYSSARSCRVLLEFLSAIDSPSVVRELYAIQNHLRRNGVIAIAEEEGRTWGGYARTLLARGSTEIPIVRNLWGLWDTPDLAAGDEVVIYGGGLEGKWEKATVQSITSSKRKIVLTSGLRYDYQDQPWVHVRDARFWPYVRLADDAVNAPILTTDHRITYNLEMRLEEHGAMLADGSSAEGQYQGTVGVGIRYVAELGGITLDGREPSAEMGGYKG